MSWKETTHSLPGTVLTGTWGAHKLKVRTVRGSGWVRLIRGTLISSGLFANLDDIVFYVVDFKKVRCCVALDGSNDYSATGKVNQLASKKTLYIQAPPDAQQFVSAHNGTDSRIKVA